ncbi:MAG: S8 family serine peptidase [Pelolinea sp.]|nr:S8 family serine peptidase [Pelolinea sp.]
MVSKGKNRRVTLSILLTISLLATALLTSGMILAQETDPTATPAEATPTEVPTATPTVVPTEEPIVVPTEEPIVVPTEEPIVIPTETPTVVPTEEPIVIPTETPTVVPTPTELPVELAPLKMQKGREVVPDQYIVVYKKNVSASSNKKSIQADIAAKGGKVKFIYDAVLNGYSAYLPPEALKKVRANPAVEYVEADGVVSISDDETGDGEIGAETTQNSATWGLDRVDQRSLPLNTKYIYNTTASSVHVYVIDTGILYTHSLFGGRATKGFDAWGGTGIDCHGHGTHVAGTIGSSTYGIAKSVKLHGVRVLDCDGSGSDSTVIDGMDWVANNRILPAVANMSLGGGASASLDTAVNYLISHSVTVVVAAGNDDWDACYYSPARVPNAITVGAIDEYDYRSYFSNWGTCLDLFAPGSDITSTWIGSSNTATNTISGTSMASPHVAGVAALYLQTHPGASPATVASAIKNGASTGKVYDPYGSPNRLLYSLVTSAPPSTSPNPISPSGVGKDRTPTYKWSKITGATKYQYQVFKGSTKVIDKVITTSGCTSTYCSNTPTTSRADYTYKWHVRAYKSGAWGAYSAYKTFYIANAFSSSFNGSMTGWAKKAGAAWGKTSTAMYTNGLTNKWSSAYRLNSIYDKFTYTAKVKRENDTYSANYLVVRGGSSVDSYDYQWYPDYIFGYANTGRYSIWKVDSTGYETALQTWTASPKIVKYGLNTLKVYGSGSTFKFYINGTLVKTVTNSIFTKGYVGFQMYKQSTSGKFLVDSASVTIPTTSALDADTVSAEQEALNQAAMKAGVKGSPKGNFVE